MGLTHQCRNIQNLINHKIKYKTMTLLTEKINGLKKGESIKVTLLEIITKKEGCSREYNHFFDGTLDEASSAVDWMKERLIISAVPKEIEVNWNKYGHDFISHDGFLETRCLQSNPNDD